MADRDDTLPWERVLWTGRPAFPNRLAVGAGERYVLTDYRLVVRGRSGTTELLLSDVDDVHRVEPWLQRLTRTSSLLVRSRHPRTPPILLRHVRRGAQLAALLELLSSESAARLDAESANAAIRWTPRLSTAGSRELLAGLAAIVVALVGVALFVRGQTGVANYAPDDPIYPAGHKQTRAVIDQFMKDEVMPWARRTLGPIKGGADRVTCETCHGRNPADRDWQMPGVAALPEPDVKERGWERYGGDMDAQMRNAIYGYAAESEKQTKAAYMRDVVMPGMARLLHRPPYDFTKTYAYNRSRLSFGCYHCHRVK